VPYFDQAIETMARRDLQALQLEKLGALLEQIDGRNRFYTQKFKAAKVAPHDIRSLQDLEHIPFTTKLELLQAQADAPPFGTNATFDEKSYTRLHQTSGTTGGPLRVVDTEETWDWWGRCWGYVLSGAGLTSSDRLLLPFSFGPFIGFWAAVEGARHIGALMIPGGGRDSQQRLNLIQELDVTAICSTPTYALRLAEVAREIGFDLANSSVRTTIHAGEPGANVPSTKQRIEKAWGAKCFDHAGASEVGAHSFECEQQPGGTHVIENEFIAEVIDPKTGEHLGAGEVGELVITNLGRVGYPVIRYRTGDLVRVNYDRCVCGRTFMRFEGGVIGRADDMVIIRGVNVFPSAIENLIRRFDGVDEFQVIVANDGELRTLEIQIEVSPKVDAVATREGVQQTITNALGLKPNVQLVPNESLPRFELKAKRFHVK
jgi:phenylacetate-CoA ligase